MSVMYDVILNLILMLFPVLIYFVYNCYRKLRLEKYNVLLFQIVLFSSMYLCFKFGHVKNNIFVILFCNLPIVFAYLKKQWRIAILLSIFVVWYSYYFGGFYYILLIFKFISYGLIYFLGNYKKIKDKTFILSIVVIQGFFLGISYFSINFNKYFSSVFELLFSLLFFYLLPFVLLYLFQLANQVTDLYFTVSEIEKEKQLKNSLFKITHEVKNPIAVCKGYLEMMDISDSKQIEKYIPIIKDEIYRSLDIMNNFMEFGRIKLKKEIIDINYLLEDVWESVRILVFNKGIVLNVHIMQNEVFIEGDYSRLKQVFINLVKNGMEAIDGDGVIKITTHLLKNMYYIEIIDNGVGMDEDTLNNVKEMFFTTKKMGSGLGVSLSNEIIMAHEGFLDYYSSLGKGTRVVVKLPVVMI